MKRTVVVILLGALVASSEGADGPPTRTTLRDDGVVLVNGVPFIPRGFYISTGHTGAIRTRCVELMAEAGFNAVHIEGPWHEDTTFLDRAAELGVYVIAGHTETEDKLWRVRKFKDHPAIIAWTIYDDANTKSDVPHLLKMNRLIKEAAPAQLTYIPIGAQSRTVPMPADAFFDCSDVVGWEDYPIGRRSVADPTVRTGEVQMARVAAVASRLRRPVWVLPQSFAWPGAREPTPAEYRNLCFVGLANNAKGVMPWSIYYKGDDAAARARKRAENDSEIWDPWYLPDHPVLWDGCKAVAREIRALTPVLVDGRYAKLHAGPDVSAACWRMPETLTVVVASLDSVRPVAVSVPLPEGTFDDPRSLFEGRPSGLKLVDSKLVGEIGPVDVHVYEIPIRPAPGATKH
jgi:hypothetical protein